MPLRLSDLARIKAFPATNEDLRASIELQKRPWKEGYPHATPDATFARERIGFKRTESIISLDLKAGTTQPIPIPGPRREREFNIYEVPQQWTHVKCMEPWEVQHWIRMNVDGHVQTEWNDPTGENDSTALGVMLQKQLTEVDTDSSAKLLRLQHEIIHERVSVISKVAQATRAAEGIAPTNARTERTHPKVQRKRGPVPAKSNGTKTQNNRGPAPRVPFAQLAKYESFSEDDKSADDDSFADDDKFADDEGGSSPAQESSGEEESSDGQDYFEGMDL